MKWGGVRNKSGRRKRVFDKRSYSMWLTEDEYRHLSVTLKSYRGGITEEAQKSNEALSNVDTAKDDTSKAAILAHIESLLSELVVWFTEYGRCISGERYKKYTLEEIIHQINLLRLQVMTLAPHLGRCGCRKEVQEALQKDDIGAISQEGLQGNSRDFSMTIWQEPEGLNSREYNLRLLGTYRFLREKQEWVARMERAQKAAHSPKRKSFTEK